MRVHLGPTGGREGGEVVQELHSDWLRRVHYFSGVDVDGHEWEVDDDFKLQLSLSMAVEVVAPMEMEREEDPMTQLKKLKELLDMGAISQAEFDEKKAPLMAKM